jgi:thiamine biosynthesis lipoprotein
MSMLRPNKGSRRWALKVLGAALVLPAGAFGLQTVSADAGYQRWQGESLGGPANLTLWHADPAFARRTMFRLRAEIERLEGVFSLFRHDSEISRLNRAGGLERASPDLVAVLKAACAMAEISQGAFDPSVQPLWRLYETHFRTHPDAAAGPSAAQIALALAAVGHAGIAIDGRRIRFEKPGMAVTLNGVAQGYITDRIADLLGQEGFEHAVVDVGETRAIGGLPEGGPWPIGIKDPLNPTHASRTITIADQAVSVSGGYGTRFGLSDSHHIFDPRTGRSANRFLDVTVIAPRALQADGLSTAIYVGGETAAVQLLAQNPGARAILTRPDGQVDFI